ncbi:hypothetical protein [Treponema denticola]|uniref:hypothetical protein n=1 Tax=Treponema denticola TaxID=158 RepID=UPI0020A5A425|nr:hypothetical protein [Treponema denticola]UTC82700.1 hypothetical protein HGJ18_05575 [Treponema denticola]
MTELKGLLENKPCFIVLEKPQLMFSIIQQDGERIKVKYSGSKAKELKDKLKGSYVKICGRYISDKIFIAENIVKL